MWNDAQGVLDSWRVAQPWVGALAAVLTLVDWVLSARRFRDELALREQARTHVWHFVVGESLRAARLPLLVGAFGSLFRASPVTAWSPLAQLGVAYLAVDFIIYWWHRVLHETELGWASHSVHHTAERIEPSVGARLGLLQRALDDVIYAPLALLGFPPAIILVAIEFNRLSQFWTHTEHIGRLPGIDWFFNSPATHRLHHEALSGGQRRNLGSNLMLWDHLFGTYQAPTDAPLQFGVVGQPDSRRFWATQLQGIQALWRDPTRPRDERNVALAFTVWFAGWAAVYGLAFGAQVFLWLCCLGNVLLLWGVWSRGNRAVSVAAVLVLGVQLCYAIDLVSRLTRGMGVWGVVDSLFDAERPLALRLMSLYHVVVPVLLLWLVRRRGYWRGAFFAALAVYAGVFALCLQWVSALPAWPTFELNLNFVAGFEGFSTVGVALRYPLLFLLPTAVVLHRAFGPRPTSP